MYVHILGTGGTISSRTREGAGATATDGATGDLGAVTTTSTTNIPVAEIQTINNN